MFVCPEVTLCFFVLSHSFVSLTDVSYLLAKLSVPTYPWSSQTDYVYVHIFIPSISDGVLVVVVVGRGEGRRGMDLIEILGAVCLHDLQESVGEKRLIVSCTFFLL